MIILKKPRICFLNGFMAQELGKLDIANHLKEEIPNIELPIIRSNPKFGLSDLDKIKNKNWDLVIGLSMGGVYALRVKSKKTLLINSGLGISEGIKTKVPEFSEGFKKLEELPIIARNVTGMIALDDKIRFYIEPEFIKLFGKKNLINYPGKHIPTIKELDKYIIPEIYKLLQK